MAPLEEGKSEAAFKHNIKKLYDENKKKPVSEKRKAAQIAAIAYSEQRKARKEGK